MVRKLYFCWKKLNFPVIWVLHPSEMLMDFQRESIIFPLLFMGVDRFCTRMVVSSSENLF